MQFPMIKARPAVFGALAFFVVSGIAASTASASGPFWHVGGSKFETGTRQIKLQSKGAVIFKSPNIKLEIECKSSVSEGGTIEGSTTTQGQGKGRLSFSSCKLLAPKAECEIGQPIVTNPLKSYLANSVTPVTQTKAVEIFEPGQGVVFTQLKLLKCTPLTEVGITGSIAAEVTPRGVEAQEGLVVFPGAAIIEVNHEGTIKKVKLETVGVADTLVGAYGVRLATFPEKFGIFEQ